MQVQTESVSERFVMAKTTSYMQTYRAKKLASTQPVSVPMSAAQVDNDVNQAAAVGQAPPDSISDSALSQADIQRLVAAQDAYLEDNPDADIARSLYISAKTDSAGYSMSQNLNYKLEHGGALNGNESFIYQNLRGAMQPLGVDATLNRGAHADVVQALGLHHWSGMTDAQLDAAVKGKSWVSNSFSSTSYDLSKNPFLSGAQSGGREVVLNLHVSKQTRVMLGAKKQTEVVLDVGTHFQVTGAKFTGVTATPRTGVPTKQIALDVDVW